MIRGARARRSEIGKLVSRNSLPMNEKKEFPSANRKTDAGTRTAVYRSTRTGYSEYHSIKGPLSLTRRLNKWLNAYVDTS